MIYILCLIVLSFYLISNIRKWNIHSLILIIVSLSTMYTFKSSEIWGEWIVLVYFSLAFIFTVNFKSYAKEIHLMSYIPVLTLSPILLPEKILLTGSLLLILGFTSREKFNLLPLSICLGLGPALYSFLGRTGQLDLTTSFIIICAWMTIYLLESKTRYSLLIFIFMTPLLKLMSHGEINFEFLCMVLIFSLLWIFVGEFKKRKFLLFNFVLIQYLFNTIHPSSDLTSLLLTSIMTILLIFRGRNSIMGVVLIFISLWFEKFLILEDLNRVLFNDFNKLFLLVAFIFTSIVIISQVRQCKKL